MTSQAILEGFRPALDMIRNGQSKTIVTDNPLVDLVSTFETDPRFVHFLEDLQYSLSNEYGDSLADAAQLKFAAETLDLFMDKLSAVKREMALKSDLIIEEKANAGIMVEGGFGLEPIIKTGRRQVNTTLIKAKYAPKWESLLSKALENLKDSYRPTQAELKVEFGKGWDALLTPGEETIEGYNVVSLNSQPEKAAEVEL